MIFGPPEGFTATRNFTFYPKMLPIRVALMAITFLFFKIIEKFQVLVKGIDWGKKKYFCHFRVSQIFFFQKIKIKCQNSLLGACRGGPFFWPIVFPDQFTMKSKKKPKGVISFFRVFLQFGTPYFSKF